MRRYVFSIGKRHWQDFEEKAGSFYDETFWIIFTTGIGVSILIAGFIVFLMICYIYKKIRWMIVRHGFGKNISKSFEIGFKLLKYIRLFVIF